MGYTLSGWSNDAKKVISNAMKLACRYGSTQVGVEHIFLSIIHTENTAEETDKKYCTPAFEHFGIDTDMVWGLVCDASMIDEKTPFPFDDKDTLDLNPQVAAILEMASVKTLILTSKKVDPRHILLSIVNDTTNIPSIVLRKYGVEYKDFLRYFKKIGDGNTSSIEGRRFYARARIHIDSSKQRENDLIKTPNSKGNRGTKNSATPMLDVFGKDLTLLARKGSLDPVIGRDKEIARVIQILSRRKKNNPIIIGEPGVGKTVIVEGLASRISMRDVPTALENKRIIAIDVNSLVAGTQFRGQFEERIKGILQEIERNPDVIIFIDEIHSIVGAGGVQGTLDLSEIIKPKLARGDLQCIGSTTLAEYRTKIEKDGALKRRFQKVLVQPPNTAETIEILRNIREHYEKFHGVSYSDEAIEACVTLSERYITDRFLPDKAIDIMDEAGAKHQLHSTYPQELRDIKQQIEQLREKHSQDLQQNLDTKELDNQISKLENKAQKLKNSWLKSSKNNIPTIELSNITAIVSQMTGIPLDKIDKSEHHNLRNMDLRLKQAVVGQDKAIDTLCRALKSSKLGLKDPKRPIGSFLFLGATGVGKTELAKTLATQLFHRENALIRVDMSEYMEKFTVTRLIGAPPGFVGYEEGGSLSEKVRNNPYSVILLDEIEKAHPDIYNLLLQILDDGVLTDSFGRSIDFRNTVIIMTSNLGIRQFQDFGTGVGFNTQHRRAEEHKYLENHIQQALKKRFAPEFLNRIDDIIIFNQLSIENLRAILAIHIAKLNQRLAQNHIHITLSKKAELLICQKSHNPQYGARPLRRTIQHEIEDRLVDFLLGQALIPDAQNPLQLLVDKDKGDSLQISILQAEAELV